LEKQCNAYDAAGRMVKDGNKALSYGWFNKVMNISENGKTVADYDYTVDGQLAKSNVSGKEESFVWDDLANIEVPCMGFLKLTCL